MSLGGIIENSVFGRGGRHEFTRRSLDKLTNCIFVSDHSPGGCLHSALRDETSARSEHRYDIAACGRTILPLREVARTGHCQTAVWLPSLLLLLRIDGISINHKKLRRLYAEERLQVRRRGGRKKALGTRAPMTLSQRPNYRWSLHC